MADNNKMSHGDPLLVRVQLRADVKCSLQHSNQGPYYQLEDPLTGKFYRLGVREWSFVRELDGKRLLRDCIPTVQVADEKAAVTERDAIALVRWLHQVQLVTFRDGFMHGAFHVEPAMRQTPNTISNPLFIKLNLFNPDRMLDRCLPYLAWSISPIAFVLWLMICIYGSLQILSHWDRFTHSVATILAPNNWLWLLVAWCALKAVHELYHGLICKKYGGEVPRCGLIFILFSPIAFVDVTSSWRFRSKWQRIYTAAGGMYVEFFVASVAAIIWTQTDQPLLAQSCQNVIMMASLSTLLCNANCLMRFDGYYILTDVLGIQNLYGKGQQYLRYLNRRYLLGVTIENPLDRHPRPYFMRGYAIASLVWRWFFYVGILVAASVMFHGAGLVLAVLAALAWWVIPALKYFRYVLQGNGQEKPSLLRFGTVVAAAAVLTAMLLQLPWPGGVSAVGVVQYDSLNIYRVQSSGFVQEIYVQSGQEVRPGQTLATLRNPQTELELAEIDLEIEESKVRSRVLHGDQDVVSYQVEIENRASLLRQRKELQQQVDDLVIVAIDRGRVIERDLQTLVGQYFKSGSVLMSVGDENQKQIHLSIAQEDVDFFVKQVNHQPFVRIKGRPRPIREATLIRIDPRATRSLVSPALAAANGGPLAVAVDDALSDGSHARLETPRPRFSGILKIPPELAVKLCAGELAKARMSADGDTIGGHLLSFLRRWLTKQSQLATT